MEHGATFGSGDWEPAGGAERVRSATDLEALLARLDGRSYKAYRDLRGMFTIGDLRLRVDHVQADPFAPPSLVRVWLPLVRAGFPAALWNTATRHRALADFLLREASRLALQGGRVTNGSGHSGRLLVDAPGAEVLERSACRIDGDGVELRLRIGLPASGRRILGRGARTLLLEAVPALAWDVMQASSHPPRVLAAHVCAVEDQVVLRQQLAAEGLVAFMGEGSILPRQSGADQRPLATAACVRLEAPPSLRVGLRRADGSTIVGLGIPEGVTLIVGGGFHGKSTLLAAMTRGVYDHPPGDGRESCVTRADALAIRAEDGRAVTAVDISPFIGTLPGGVSTRAFSTANASGSTSQAAAIMEALEAGTRTLLIDEDTSATNFMVRDARMQRLVPTAAEPIVPLIDRVRELHRVHGVSTVLVMGGSGDYFDVADHVLRMHEYRAGDVTGDARRIARQLGVRESEARAPMSIRWARQLRLGRTEGRAGGRDRSISRRRDQLRIGEMEVELGALEQLVSTAQTRAIADAIDWLRGGKSTGTMSELLDAHERELDERGLDGVAGWPTPDRARPRRQELAAAISRYRRLSVLAEGE